MQIYEDFSYMIRLKKNVQIFITFPAKQGLNMVYGKAGGLSSNFKQCSATGNKLPGTDRKHPGALAN